MFVEIFLLSPLLISNIIFEQISSHQFKTIANEGCQSLNSCNLLRHDVSRDQTKSSQKKPPTQTVNRVTFPLRLLSLPTRVMKKSCIRLDFLNLDDLLLFFSAAMLRLGGLKQICYKVLPVSLGGNDAFPTVSNYHCVEFQSVQLSIGGIWPIGLENEHEIVCPKSNGTSTPLDLSNCGLEISICCVTFKSSSLAAFPSNRGKLEVRRNVKQLRSWISKVNPF